MGQSDGNAAGAGSYIRDVKLLPPASRAWFRPYAKSFEGNFNYVFGFRPRDQNVGRDFKFQAPKFLVAGEMLRRDSTCTVSDPLEILLTLRCIEFVLGMRVKPRAVVAECVHQQQFRS